MNQWGGTAVKPFLDSITLFVKAYMPGEILSYVEGEVEDKVWQQELNLGEVYKNKPTIDIEVISAINKGKNKKHRGGMAHPGVCRNLKICYWNSSLIFAPIPRVSSRYPDNDTQFFSISYCSFYG